MAAPHKEGLEASQGRTETGDDWITAGGRETAARGAARLSEALGVDDSETSSGDGNVMSDNGGRARSRARPRAAQSARLAGPRFMGGGPVREQ